VDRQGVGATAFGAGPSWIGRIVVLIGRIVSRPVTVRLRLYTTRLQVVAMVQLAKVVAQYLIIFN